MVLSINYSRRTQRTMIQHRDVTK